MGNRAANREGLENENNMRVIWLMNFRVRVEQLGLNNLFLFHFRSRDDRRRVFAGGCASEWGELLGSVEAVSVVGSRMRVRVRMDITKPLRRGLRVRVGEASKEISLILQYERLPDFCFDCGMIRHKHLECSFQDDEKTQLPINKKGRFGVWLRAPSPPRCLRPMGKHTESGETVSLTQVTPLKPISWDLTDETDAIDPSQPHLGELREWTEEQRIIQAGDRKGNGDMPSLRKDSPVQKGSSVEVVDIEASKIVDTVQATVVYLGDVEAANKEVCL
ncbi:Zinc knuckle CX2CX4HX4C [Trema orientale]|uniref:Zinc knuckle CX2CX4HX4C n=1 Tax=Trema orientale TaxID=63057 RepID=A0A2P5EM24_TREOI|nr:Zinc knuckle CX2CX4HX4C [Trema orientale]